MAHGAEKPGMLGALTRLAAGRPSSAPAPAPPSPPPLSALARLAKAATPPSPPPPVAPTPLGALSRLAGAAPAPAPAPPAPFGTLTRLAARGPSAAAEPPVVERRQIVRFLNDQADKQPRNESGAKVATVLRANARVIEYQTGPARDAAVAHLAESARKLHGEAGKALSQALDAIRVGRHAMGAPSARPPSARAPLGGEEPASSAPDPRARVRVLGGQEARAVSGGPGARPVTSPASLPPSSHAPVQEDAKKAIVRYVGATYPQFAGAEGRVVGRTGHDIEVQWRERGGAHRTPKAGDPRWFQDGEVRVLHGYSEDFRRESETWPEHARDPDSRYLVALRDALGSERGAEEAFAVFREKRQGDWLRNPAKIRILFLALKHLLGEAAAVKAQNALADIDMPDARFQRGARVYITAGREKGRTGTVTKLFGAPSLDQREVTLELRPGERTPQVLRESIAYLDRAAEMPAQAPTPAPPSAKPSVLAGDEMQRRIARATAASSVALAHASRPDSDLRERAHAEEAHQKAAGVWLLDVADELPEGDLQRHATSVSEAHQAARDFLGTWRMEESTPVHNDAQRALRTETLRQTQAAWPRRVEDVRKALAEATSSAPAAPAAGKAAPAAQRRASLGDAEQAGAAAFDAGRARIAESNPAFVKLARGDESADDRRLLEEEWLRAWDRAQEEERERREDPRATQGAHRIVVARAQPVPTASVWKGNTDLALDKARAFAEAQGYRVFTYPLDEPDPVGRAKREVVEAQGAQGPTVRAPGGIGALAALAESRRVAIPSTPIPSTPTPALTPRDRTVDVGRGLQNRLRSARGGGGDAALGGPDLLGRPPGRHVQERRQGRRNHHPAPTCGAGVPGCCRCRRARGGPERPLRA